MDAFENISVTPGAVAELCVNRPKALNALNVQVLREMQTALSQFDSGTRALIIYGAGEKAFVAGADIGAMQQMSGQQAEVFGSLGQEVFDHLEALPFPTLAAVQGFALGGGCELALACDVVYAADDAKFGQPEVKLGLIPGFGGTARLPRKLAPGAAREWIFTGDIYDAAAALRLGLVTATYPAAELLTEVRKKAARIASRAPLAVRAAKALLCEDAALRAALLAERRAFAGLFEAADTQEGLQAFLARREPSFSGK